MSSPPETPPLQTTTVDSTLSTVQFVLGQADTSEPKSPSAHHHSDKDSKAESDKDSKAESDKDSKAESDKRSSQSSSSRSRSRSRSQSPQSKKRRREPSLEMREANLHEDWRNIEAWQKRLQAKESEINKRLAEVSLKEQKVGRIEQGLHDLLSSFEKQLHELHYPKPPPLIGWQPSRPPLRGREQGRGRQPWRGQPWRGQPQRGRQNFQQLYQPQPISYDPANEPHPSMPSILNMVPPLRPLIPAGFHGDHNAYKRHLQNQKYWAKRNLKTQEEKQK